MFRVFFICFWVQRLNLEFRYVFFVCALPEKAVPEMTYRPTVSGGTLNPTHLLALVGVLLEPATTIPGNSDLDLGLGNSVKDRVQVRVMD